MRTALRASLLTITFLAASSAPANALEIFGNTGLGNAGRQFGANSLQYKQLAQGFTMGSTSYQLTSVFIGLNLGATVPDFSSNQITVSLFNDSGSNTPGTSIVTFNSVTPSLATGRAEYEFKYTGTQTLAATTKYWVVVQNIPGTSPLFDWSYAAGNPSDKPTALGSGSGVSYIATLGTQNTDPSNWTRDLSTSFSNLRFSVNVVPEPSTYALGAIGTLVMGAVARRKSRKSASD